MNESKIVSRNPSMSTNIPHPNHDGRNIDAKYTVCPLYSWLASPGFRPTEYAIMRVPIILRMRPDLSINHSIIFFHITPRVRRRAPTLKSNRAIYARLDPLVRHFRFNLLTAFLLIPFWVYQGLRRSANSTSSGKTSYSCIAWPHTKGRIW